MKQQKGLFTDSTETDQPEGTYRFAKNIVDSNTLGAKENEPGFIQKNWGVVYPFLGVAAHTVIGLIPIDVGFVVFSTDEINSEIGLYNTTANTYVVIYNDAGNALNFKRTAPIKGEYRIEVTGNRVITWIDDNNPPRILNIDNLSLVNSVNDLNIFQDVQNPRISAYSISDSGGSLPVAAYTLFSYYKGNDGSKTNFYVHDKVFYINDDPKSSPFNVDDGAVGLTASNKAINVTFTNGDTNYDNIVVGFIRVANQVTTAYTAITRTVSSVMDITITGSESLESVTLDEILTANSVYATAKAITQINGSLVLGNLTSTTLPNFQALANNILVNYTTSLVNVISNTNSHKDTLAPGFMPGEVYAFYIGLELKKGGWVFYHIPGRPEVANDKTHIVTSDGLDYLYYQVSDTTDKGGSGATTNMGFWENVTETYPNSSIYGSLAGAKVRHHRFPSVNQLETLYYSGDTTVGVTQLAKLGISVSNVVIPADIQSQINGWKIFFAKKSASNSVMGGSDLLQFSFTGPSSPSTYWTTGGNWKIDAPHSGWESMLTIHTDAILGHCLDHLYAPGEFLPDFAVFSYGLTNKTINNASNTAQLPWNGFRGGGSLLSTTGSNRGQTVGVVIDYTESSTTKVQVNALRKLNNYQFIPQNSKVGVFKSAYAEGFYAATMASVGFPVGLFTTIPSLQTKGSGDVAPSPVQFSNGEQTCFMQYGKIVANAHTSFTSQTLVPLEGVAVPAATTLVPNGGDTFLSYMSYLTAGPLNANHATTSGNPGFEGVRVWRSYVGYSRRNWNYRHQTAGTSNTYYYGKTDPTTLYSPALRTPVDVVATGTTGTLLSSFDTFNNIQYNPDFNKLNEFTIGTVYSVDVINATSFPTLIIYSTQQGTESSDVSWRLFPSANRYTMPKDNGDIINLQAISNIDLLIHHEFTLYKTRTNAGLTADGENIYLKSNELFALAPQELVATSTGSYCGTQNKFGCALTKLGYVFVDDLQGKIFVLGDREPEEISAQGMRKFFRDNMNVQQDNPFYANGYTISYDEFNNRLLVTKKQGATSWTASYNPATKSWVSFHDYTPDFLLNDLGNELFSINSNKLYRHNTGARGKFYNGVVYPSYIDVVYNPEPTRDKVFVEASWLTESYDASGVLQYTDTLTHLTFRSLDYCTGKIVLSVFSDIDLLYTNNIRNLNRVWYFNDIRDISISPGFTFGFYQNYDIDTSKLNTNMEWYDQRKFTDKFVICRHEYSNASGNKLLLLESDIEYRYAPK